MTVQTKSTHNGHCQRCGRIQAVQAHNGKLAKHGYTVKGWPCAGSDRLPLQQERTLTDSTCDAVRDLAVRMEERATNLKTGTLLPETVRGQYNPKKHAYDELPFEQGDSLQKSDAIQRAITSAQVEARHAHMYVRDMQTLAAGINGTALIPRERAPKVEVVAPTVDVKSGVVTGTYTTKTARQADLERIGRLYEKAHRAIQQMYLDSDKRDDQEATDLVYYGPMYLNNWRPKHSTATLKHFPQAASLVAEIEALVKAREAIKKA